MVTAKTKKGKLSDRVAEDEDEEAVYNDKEAGVLNDPK